MTISTNTTDDLQLVFQNLKSKARTTSRTSVQERIDKLKKLEAYLRNPTNIKSLETALYNDFKKHPVEVMSSEISAIIQQITHVKKKSLALDGRQSSGYTYHPCWNFFMG
jgi:aldehyde dehydrogenase (NAD+)